MNNVKVRELDRHLYILSIRNTKILENPRSTLKYITRSCISFFYNYIFFLICFTSLIKTKLSRHDQVR